MFSDYLFPKILILIVILSLLLVGFYFVVSLVKKAFHKEKEHDVDEFSYHFDKLNEKKAEEARYIQKLTDAKAELAELEKRYEDGIFYKNNIKIWQASRNLYEDLYRWKAKPFPIDESEVDFFLEDFEPVFKELGIEVIKPVVGEIFNPEQMRYRETVSDPTKLNNEITEVKTFGYSLKLKTKTKVLQEAEVIINKK